MKKYQLAILSAVAVGYLAGLEASAQLSYSQGDLLLGFRNGTSSGSDLVVDIGSASLYTGATGPITISGNYYSSSQLTAAGLNLNSLYFSVFGDTSGNTLWVTANSTLSRHTTYSQSVAAGQFEAIGQGAEDAGSYYSANAANTSSAVIMPNGFNVSGTDLSYTQGILDPNTGLATFQYFPVANEANTSAGFSAGTSSIFLNLYQLNPYSNNTTLPPGTLLGDFELDPNGTLTFNPVPEPSTWALLGGGLLTLIAIRRIKNFNKI